MPNKKDDLIALKSILTKTHQIGGNEAVEKFIQSDGKELPPLKLSPAEMEAIKGGDWADIKESYAAAKRGYKRDGAKGVAISLADSFFSSFLN